MRSKAWSRPIKPSPWWNWTRSRTSSAAAVSRAVGDVPIGDLINVEGRHFGRHTTLVIITPSTEQDWVLSLLTLTQRGVKVAVVLLEASTFGGRSNSLMVVSSLAAADIWTYLVKQGDDLTNTLAPISEGFQAEERGAR